MWIHVDESTTTPAAADNVYKVTQANKGAAVGSKTDSLLVNFFTLFCLVYSVLREHQDKPGQL